MTDSDMLQLLTLFLSSRFCLSKSESTSVAMTGAFLSYGIVAISAGYHWLKVAGFPQLGRAGAVFAGAHVRALNAFVGYLKLKLKQQPQHQQPPHHQHHQHQHHQPQQEEEVRLSLSLSLSLSLARARALPPSLSASYRPSLPGARFSRTRPSESRAASRGHGRCQTAGNARAAAADTA